MILQLSPTRRTPFKSLIPPLFLRQLGTRFQRRMVDRLKDSLVQLLRRIRGKGQTESEKCVRKPRHTNSDWTMSKVGRLRAGDGVAVHVDNLVEVACYYFGDRVKGGMVEVCGGVCGVGGAVWSSGGNYKFC